jgi:Raf kinase inhibitor-like YbhB/YbcL family protein
MLTVRSRAFEPHGAIPRRYTCEGEDVAPPLEWSGAPAGTRSFALVVDDPDAPDPAAPKRTWVHWVVVDLPPSVTSLPEGGALPPGARSGVNDWRRTGYGGPCPPIGRHRYFHRIYALDTVLGLEKPTKAELLRAMEGHVLDQGELVGTYQKGR